MTKKVVVALAILLWAVLLLAPAAAAGAELDMQHRLNFNTGFDYSRWNLLQVTVTNHGPESWQGTVEVHFGGGYIEEVYIASGTKIEVIFLLPPFNQQSFFGTDGNYPLFLKDTGGRVVKTARVGGGNPRQGPVIGVLADSPEMFNRLTTIFTGSSVVHLREEHFQEAGLLEGFSLLVVSAGGQATLQPGQKERLARWVEGGGMLVLGGGRGWRGTAAMVPEEMLPFRPTGAAERLDPLPFRSTRPPASYLAATGTVLGRVLLKTGELPLLVAREYGRGRVFYSTLNLEDAPFSDGAALEDFWQQFYLLAGEDLYRRLAAPEKYMIQELLQMLSQGGREPHLYQAGHIFAGILLYVLLAGPASFLVLRRLRRWEWGWLTIPALAVLFTAAIYLAASSGRGSDYALYQVNFVEMQRDNRALAESYGALFVPRRGAAAFDSPVAALAPGKGAVVERGTAPAACVLRLDNPALWSMQRLYASRPLELAGPVKMEGVVASNGIKVTVANETGHLFFDAWLRFPGGWQRVGPLESGETKTVLLDRGVSMDFSAVYTRYAGQHHYRPYWPEEMFTGPADLLLVGFNDTLPVLELSGTVPAAPLTVFMAGLDMRDLAIEGSFTLREGWLAPRVIGHDSKGGYHRGMPHPHHPELYLHGPGQVDLVFSLPRGIDYAAGEYIFQGSRFNGNGTVEVQVYNRSRGEWEEAGEILSPGGKALTLERMAERVVEDRLLVRLKYQGEMWVDTRSLFSARGGVLP